MVLDPIHPDGCIRSDLMFEGTVTVRFSAGHRLLHHGGKCRYPHGHSYRVEITLRAAEIGQEDWIEDFGRAKDIAGKLITETVDHAFILDSRDTELIGALKQVHPVRLHILDEKAPTAERIAEDLHHLLKQSLPNIYRIDVWETDLQRGSFIESDSL